jgi:acetyl-CoA carboxylase carboxyl transferase subunit beta
LKETRSKKAKSVRTEGLWQKCESCGQIIWRKAVEEGLEVCPKCEHHFRIGAAERLKLLFDDGTFTPHDADLKSSDPLQETAIPFFSSSRSSHFTSVAIGI